jgi:hypothetical protein
VIKVIHEVDIALRSLIEREATDGTEVEVVFDAPTKDWASRRNVPTIDVYLYDIREDLRRRERGLINEYDERDRITTRHLPPRHFKLSYLVTAWTQRPEDEHRLLSALLSCFLRHDSIPSELVTGPLADLGLPVPVTVALPPPEDRSFADVWSALGGELKPSLDIVVSAPTHTGQQYAAGPPVVSPPRVSLGGSGAWPPREVRQQVNGPATVVGPADGQGAGRSGTVSGRGASGRAGAGDDSREGGGRGSGGGDASGRSGDAGRSAGSAGTGRARTNVTGMSWKEFAGSATPRPGATDAAGANDAAGASDAAGAAGASAAPEKPKPTRRRKQGGITQQ